MHAWNYFPMLAQLLFLLSLCNTRHTASWETCPRDSNFTTNSTYHFNLNLLLPSLTSATVSTGYANTSAGRSPDQVFGLARCQLDVSQDKCQACLATAVDTLLSSCPSAKDAATWGDLCFLAYSNTTFSNDRDKSSFTQIIVNGGEVSETSRFVDLVGELMNALISWAAYKTDSMFAIGQANFTSVTKVYGLVQCTRDQSDDDCFLCLRQSLGLMQSCCDKNQGGVVLKYRCFLRYETYSYYNMSVPTSPLPPLSSALSSAPPPGATANPPPPPAVVDSNSSSSSAIDAEVGGAKSEKPNSLLFDFETLKVATNNFSDANKLGEGGFGPVYKGVLSDGQEVAVKRLARSSQQGFAELRNEVAFVAKLQHRNLVRLIGFCSEEEKLLVYEFLPNTSLDKILFDPTKCGQLNWERRYKIIEGIARGLLYLHEDSRLRIIHRDLKPGNILLDQHMNPKISDFGLSKLLVDQDRSEESASRIVGTNGYIAPEYALLRHVSDKSDVYSYGVLVLEIITGRRISEFRGSGHRANLQSYAWKNWSKGKALQIVDQNLCGRFQREEALPCIRTALLCVQENPSKRPTMASVVRMLSSSSTTTLSPSAPGFLIEASGTTDSNESTGNRSPEIKNEREGSSTSINEVSITVLEPRQ
ncbi:cysteine-rich receptor-like protein kinase 44 [Musa acuminata AAA Group]|uniref:cysteine-rich receptor-like protein kinase 44 n=1 Tax=Musa acuminata AAA Group TaxID=214697 RepID=UPI0031D25EDA